MPNLCDVSNWQGQPNWDAVKAAGIDGAICKLAEWNAQAQFVDQDFARNWSELERLGMARGLYYFAHPELHSAAAEAQFCIANLPPLKPGDLVCLDMEMPTDGSIPAATLSAWALEWLQTVEAHIGYRPFLYTYPYYAESSLTDARLAQYPLWLASYTAACPTSIGVWSSITLWQNSWQGSIAGISGDVDTDVYYPPIDHLKAYGKPAPVAPHPRFKVTTATHMRVSHTKPSPYSKVAELKPGQIIDGTGQLTASWRQCNVDGVAGWVALKDIAAC